MSTLTQETAEIVVSIVNEHYNICASVHSQVARQARQHLSLNRWVHGW